MKIANQKPSPTHWAFSCVSELRDVEQNAVFQMLLRERHVGSRQASVLRVMDIGFFASVVLIIGHSVIPLPDILTVTCVVIFIVFSMPIRVVLIKLIPEENFLHVLTLTRLRELNQLPLTDDDYASAYWAMCVYRWPLRQISISSAVSLWGFFLSAFAASQEMSLGNAALPALILIPLAWVSFCQGYRALPYTALTDASRWIRSRVLQYREWPDRFDFMALDWIGMGGGNLILLLGVIALTVCTLGGGLEFLDFGGLSTPQACIVSALIPAILISFAHAWAKWAEGDDREICASQFRALSQDVGYLRKWLLIDADKAKTPDQS